MKINNNISAVITNKQLLRNEDSLSVSMERLSSGYKINYAKDDPSGMAISNRMRAQIRGLDRASQNASDGTSVLQTADGALNEVQSMLQRMRELSIQSANGTNSETDRQAIQDEISQLRDEVDRVSNTTEFNSKKLLDGSLDTKVYADGATREQVSTEVEAGVYSFKVNEPSTPAAIAAFKIPTSVTEKCSISINGSVANLDPSMNASEIQEAVRNAAEGGSARLNTDADGNIEDGLWSTDYGKNGALDIKVSDAATAAAFGLPTAAGGYPEIDTSAPKEEQDAGVIEYKAVYGNDAELTMDISDGSAFKDHRTATYTVDGNKVTFSDRGGFELQLLLDPATGLTIDKANELVTSKKTYDLTDESLELSKKEKKDNYDSQVKAKKDNADDGYGFVSVEVTDKGPMDLQIGANAHQQMAVKIPSTSANMLYLDKVDVTTEDKATKSIGYIDYSMQRLNEIRSAIGAYSNRLESAVASLDDTEENMTAAMSRIKDVDMAEEMTEYTKDNVLVQAGTSALSQANDIPQMALQLLQ